MVSVQVLLHKVMEDVQAVRKSERNSAQGFMFRGVDAVMNAVGPAFRKHGIVVGSEVTSVKHAQVELGQKRTLFTRVEVVVKYKFYGPEGDFLEMEAAGEAMDTGDKATAKAMSLAYRTALLQMLCLPTDEPEPDAAQHPDSLPEGALVQQPKKSARQAGSSVNELKVKIASLLPGRSPQEIITVVEEITGKPIAKCEVKDFELVLENLERSAA